MTHPPYVAQTNRTLSTLTKDEFLQLFEVARHFTAKDVCDILAPLKVGADDSDLADIEILEGCMIAVIRMYDKREQPCSWMRNRQVLHARANKQSVPV